MVIYVSEVIKVIDRREYLEQLFRWKDQKIIKVVTGVRRCGKSTLLQQFRQHLEKSGISSGQCISINFESLESEKLQEYHALYDHIVSRLVPGKMNYIFLDEIQMVSQFQRAVNSLFLLDHVDIYITGSNAGMLSGELATLLSGRYVEISMLPFSFREYYEIVGGDKAEAFAQYYRAGGFPYLAPIDDPAARREYLQGIYSTVLLKDIVARKKLADVPLLESITRFMADNIGNIVSVKKTADTLSANGRKVSTATVDSYIQALKDAFILYEARRYDIRGKQNLQSLEKYYLVDTGLRTLLLGEQARDVGRILENIVYLELIRRGYNVHIGKMDTLEVDFVAEKGDDRVYFQVSASVMDAATWDREFAPLKKIRDNYPKVVLTLDNLPTGENGIRQVNLIDFLLAE